MIFEKLYSLLQTFWVKHKEIHRGRQSTGKLIDPIVQEINKPEPVSIIENPSMSSPVEPSKASVSSAKKEAHWAKRYQKRTQGMRDDEDSPPSKQPSNKSVQASVTTEKKKFWER